MSYNGIKKLPFACAAATALVRYRFVDITKSTFTAAYSAAGSKPDGVTLAAAGADGSVYIVSIQPLSDMTETFFIDLAGTVTKGDELFATTSGEAVTATHDDIIDRGKQSAAPASPTSGDKYILPAAGWSAAHTNAIAVYTSGWAYTECDATTNVGIVCFVVDEGNYVQWTGTAWTPVNVVAYANESGVDGQAIEAYKQPKQQTRVVGYRIKTCARYSPGLTASSVAITDVNIAATDEVFATIIDESNSEYILKAVPSAGAITITFSGAMSTNATIAYMAVAPYGATE